MKHSWLKRAVCLLLAGQCALSIPASTMIEAVAIEEYNSVSAEGDVFSFDGAAVAEDADAQEDTSTDKETVISYVDIEGNYNAPETLTVYITCRAEEGKVETPVAESEYTGVVAFYDYHEDVARETPFFFYYEEGKLQSDELRFAAVKSYLDLVNPPVSESVITGVAPAADQEEEKVYAAEEVYVDQEAQDHQEYLFAFNQEEEDNGLYTGQTEGVAYHNGLAVVTETESTESQESVESADVTEEKSQLSVERAVPATTAEVKAGGVLVSWTKDNDAAGYRILRKAAGEAEWTAIDLNGGDQESYLDESVVSDTTYIYAVRSYFGDKTGAEREEETGDLWSGYQETEAIYYLAAPELTGVANAGTGLTLKWNGVAGAAGYRIYRKTRGTSEWTVLTTVGAPELSYTDTTAKAGVHYLYTVGAVNGNRESPYYDYSDDTSKYVSLHAVPDVTISGSGQDGKSGILVKWTTDATASSYRIYRKASGESGWSTVANVDGSVSSYFDAAAVSNQTYSYTVRTYYSATSYSGSGWSGYKASADLYYLAAPTLSSVNSAVDGMSVQWNTVAGATSYRIYRKTSAGASWATLATVTDGSTKSYTDKTAADGVTYYYTVRALNDKGGSYYLNPAESNTYHAPLNVALSNQSEYDGSVRLSWTKPAGATVYNIYRKAEGEKSWSLIAKVNEADFKASGSARTYYDSTVTNGKSFSYAVRAFFGNDSSANGCNRQNGYKSFQIKYVGVPALGTCVSDAAGMAVTWKAVSGAESYTVYRKAAGETGWKNLGTVNGEKTVKYIDKTAVNGVTYFYTVKAKTADASSGYITPEKSYTFHAAPAVTVGVQNDGLKLSWKADAKAVSYRVYRKLPTDKSWISIANLEGTAASYSDTTLASGTAVSYAVRAYYGNAEAGNEWSSYVAVSKTYLCAPVLTSEVAVNEGDGLKIGWQKVTGAAGYYIYRKDMSAASPKWTRVGNVQGGSVTAYLDSKDLTAGKVYYYTVVAYGSDGSSSRYDDAGTPAKYLPAPGNLFVDRPTAAGTAISWSKVTGADSYTVWRKKYGGSWTKIATATTNSYMDIQVTNDDTSYYYTVRAVASLTINGKSYIINSGYDSSGSTYAIKWSGSERNTWVFKNGKQYYVDKNGYCLADWQYVKRNGKEYKYYFEPETGELCTNLYQKFGSSYADMKCKFFTYFNASNSNPSHTTILLYDAEKESYCIPAISVRCVAGMGITEEGYFYIRKGQARRWLTNPELEGATYEQYAVYLKGSTSWYHSLLYRTDNYKNFISSTYNSLANNVNNSLGCIRFQAIYSYLFCDIVMNGYGATNRIYVEMHRNSSVKSPFGTPKINKISSRKTDPTDPAVTGKFFYTTSIFGVKGTAGASTWTYYV